MPEQKTEATAKPATEPKPEKAPAAPKPKPGESTDPVVHQLIAVRHSHAMALAELDAAQERRKEHEEAIADIDEQLRDKGYDVG